MLEREGEGWRLAWDAMRSPFPLLVGGQGWAIELTSAEGQVLHRAVEMVCRQHHDLAGTLMDEEAITLEFHGTLPGPDTEDGGSLWLALEGDRHRWTLRLILQPPSGQRAVEGAWCVGAAAAFAQALSAPDWPFVAVREGPSP
ncbi:MAG: DUF1818 family protein [Cyanobacteriota bacterium]